MIIGTPTVYFLGLATALTMFYYKKDPNWSQSKEKARLIGQIHKYFAYSVFILSSITIFTGLKAFDDKFGIIEKNISTLNLIIFYCVFLVHMFTYLLWRSKSKVLIKTPIGGNDRHRKLKEISFKDFMTEVHYKKRNLAIFDNLVLDFEMYWRYHPGGKFALI